MTTTSLRQFSRNADLRKDAAKNGKRILVESREKNGEKITFMVIPLPKELTKKENHSLDLSSFVGSWKSKKKTSSRKEDKKILKDLWTKN